MGEMRNEYRILVGKPEGKRPLEIRWRGWEDGIKWISKKQGMRMRTGFILFRFYFTDESPW
jgi:hypothetical protein